MIKFQFNRTINYPSHRMPTAKLNLKSFMFFFCIEFNSYQKNFFYILCIETAREQSLHSELLVHTYEFLSVIKLVVIFILKASCSMLTKNFIGLIYLSMRQCRTPCLDSVWFESSFVSFITPLFKGEDIWSNSVV